MADIPQLIRPIKLELDSDESLRTAINAAYLKNVRGNVNINTSIFQGNTINLGSNEGTLTPSISNQILCDITLPSGENICTGVYRSPKTYETYWENWNSLGQHTIWVYGTETQTCRKVYQGECLNIQFEPQFHIPDHRATLFVVYDQSDSGNKTIKSKYYVYTDGFNWQFFIDVETSIATDSFNETLYPYFATYYPYCDPCEYVQLGARPPLDCPKVLPLDDDTQLQFYENEPEGNFLVKKVWYFRYAYVFTDGRVTVMSPISTATFLGGGDCESDPAIKCFRLQLSAGSALVEKIRVYFSNDGISWYLYDTIEKWNNCMSPQPENFWERELALNNYYALNSNSPACDDTGCFSTFTYTWDLASSPTSDFDSFSIVIDGQTYTNNNINAFRKILLWLNGLGKGTFTLDDAGTGMFTTSSASIVYGTMTLGTSPEEEFEPTIAAVDQCGTVNTFIYQFCGNKQCELVDQNESDRLFDELPIVSIAQTNIDNKISFGDNLTGYDNLHCPIDQITLTAEQDTVCEPEEATITIDMVVHNPYGDFNNFIYIPDGSTDYAFGGFSLSPPTNKWENEVISSYKQQIVNAQHGFIGHLRGTSYSFISKQYKINDLTTPVIPTGLGYNAAARDVGYDIYSGNYFIQRFQFKVPRGNYIFEVCSHLATGLDDCVGTSTYFQGTILKTNYNPTADISANTNNNIREIAIHACDGDVTYPDYIVISDLTKPKDNISIASDARALCGYLKEKDTNIAVELAELHINSSVTIQSFGTDAYGFYFASDNNDFIAHLNVFNVNGSPPCALTDAHVGGVSADQKQLLQVDLFVDNPAIPDYNECAHELITGTMEDCEGRPLSGIPVVLTRTGRFAVTDTNGQYTILAHDNANIFSQTGETRKTENVDSLVISQQGACILDTCDASPECQPCIPVTHVNWLESCFNCPVETITINFTLRLLSGALTGWKTGGRYAVDIIATDYLGRTNGAQRVGYINIPTIQSNGVFAPYQVHWSIAGLMDFPSWVKQFKFAVSGNLNSQFLLSWATNKVEFVDSSGNITAPSVAANIKVYIDGLNNFNTENLLNTNTNYQWVKGDFIRWITNGDGTTFDTTSNNGTIDLPVSAEVNGNVLLIPFDARLVDLTANATFELYRESQCTTTNIYLEQCPEIPVLYNATSRNYEPTTTSGTIPFFDTYWFFRAIPQTDKDGNPYIFVNPHRYEHFAPSDFWGTGGDNSNVIRLFATGRPFAENPQGRQTWRQDEIVWSDDLLEDGNINGLSTFRSANKKNYGIQDLGGIVAMKAQVGLLFVLAENNWFVVNISQNLLMVTEAGNIQANPNFMGNRQQKVGNVYGCDFRDTNTILFINEVITWADIQRNAYCLSNYQTVWDITQEIEGVSQGGMKSYWTKKFKKISELRSQNQFTDNFMFLVSGYDPVTNEIVTTSSTRTETSPQDEISYVSHEKDWDIEVAETVSFNLTGFWSGSYIATPENWIYFGSGKDGNQFVAFKQGQAWIQHPLLTTGITYNKAFGEQGESVIKFVMNGGEGNNQLQKIFLAIRVLCKEQKFYCDEATTQTGQVSKIPSEAFERISNYFESPILMDENSDIVNGISKLIDGTNLFGTWVKIRLLQESGKESEYFEVSGIIISSAESY